MPGFGITNFFRHTRKIIGIGRNFRNPGENMPPVPKTPLLFLKSPSSLLQEGNAIKIPEGCSNVIHEVELCIVIGNTGSKIPVEKAHDYIGGYALVLDMTARDFLQPAIKNGHPWTLIKSWDTFCPISDFIPKDAIPNPQDVNLWLKVNGNLKQSGNTSDMILQIPELIHYISTIMTLEKGDLILSGTPNGMGPVKCGDVIECGIKGLKEMTFSVE